MNLDILELGRTSFVGFAFFFALITIAKIYTGHPKSNQFNSLTSIFNNGHAIPAIILALVCYGSGVVIENLAERYSEHSTFNPIEDSKERLRVEAIFEQEGSCYSLKEYLFGGLWKGGATKCKYRNTEFSRSLMYLAKNLTETENFPRCTEFKGFVNLVNSLDSIESNSKIFTQDEVDYVKTVYYYAKNSVYMNGSLFIEMNEIRGRSDFSRSLVVVSYIVFILQLVFAVLTILSILIVGARRAALGGIAMRFTDFLDKVTFKTNVPDMNFNVVTIFVLPIVCIFVVNYLLLVFDDFGYISKSQHVAILIFVSFFVFLFYSSYFIKYCRLKNSELVSELNNDYKIYREFKLNSVTRVSESESLAATEDELDRKLNYQSLSHKEKEEIINQKKILLYVLLLTSVYLIINFQFNNFENKAPQNFIVLFFILITNISAAVAVSLRYSGVFIKKYGLIPAPEIFQMYERINNQSISSPRVIMFARKYLEEDISRSRKIIVKTGMFGFVPNSDLPKISQRIIHGLEVLFLILSLYLFILVSESLVDPSKTVEFILSCCMFVNFTLFLIVWNFRLTVKKNQERKIEPDAALRRFTYNKKFQIHQLVSNPVLSRFKRMQLKYDKSQIKPAKEIMAYLADTDPRSITAVVTRCILATVFLFLIAWTSVIGYESEEKEFNKRAFGYFESLNSLVNK